MRIVHDLYEGLNPTSPLYFLRTHATRYFPGVTLDTSHDCMSVRSVLRAFIDLLDYDDLLARLTALQDDSDLGNMTLQFSISPPIAVNQPVFTFPGL